MIIRRGGGWSEMEREDWTRGLFCQWSPSRQVYPTYTYLLPDFPAVFFHIFHWYLSLEKSYQQESVELHPFRLSQPLATIKVNITTIPFPLTLPLAIGLPAARCIPPIHTFPPSQQSSSTWPLVISTKFRMSRFSLVSPSAKVTSFKSQHNNTIQSEWRSERVSDKQEKSVVLGPVQS